MHNEKKYYSGTLADVFCKTIINNLNRNDYSHSTCRSINNITAKYDLSNGEIPLTTIIPVFTTSVAFYVLNRYKKYFKIIDSSNTIEFGNFTYEFKNNKINTDVRESFLDSAEKIFGECVAIHYSTRERDGIKYLDMIAMVKNEDLLITFFKSQLTCAIALMIAARHIGYTPGELLYCASKVIASNSASNIVLLNDILRREPIDCSPYIRFNPTKRAFYDLTERDIAICGYPIEEIKKVHPIS